MRTVRTPDGNGFLLDTSMTDPDDNDPDNRAMFAFAGATLTGFLIVGILVALADHGIIHVFN